MGLLDQPRAKLATLPTPLHLAERLSAELGGPRIYLKRDDLTGLAFGGNKTRKLEYLVGDARTLGATHLITTGGAQSNHARQTAAAARWAGMTPVLVINSSTPQPALQGNLLLDQLFGAEIHLVTSEAERAQKMDELAADLRDSGAVPYIIPGGGSNGVGALGYVAAMLELQGQLYEQHIAPKRVYFAAGGGGTHGGIAVGGALFGVDYDLVGVLVEDTSAEGIERAFTVAAWCAERLGIANPVDKAALIADDSQVGAGYGIPTDACLEAIRLLARTEGVLLDPVYTAKAFAGLIADIRAGMFTADDSVVFIHTGGAPALFAMVDMIAPILG
ncbi:MAG: D-cysteine desulfhydrase family protein [Chloroflexi bacterium]|nr:MAG: D-cysteine desulfhydrase family protein [Chloroflexota bacterium]